MATLYIAEHAKYQHTLNGVAPGLVLAEQTVAIGGSSVQSSAFQTTTRLIRVHCDAICSIAIGTNPTATSSTRRMVAGQTEYWDVQQGDKIAVITNS